MAGTDYQNLQVWQRSVNLVVDTYVITKQLPKSEERGISSQIQRSAVSIPSNIAEGYRRKSKLEFKRFLNIALGSGAELETQLIIVNRVYHLDTSTIINELIIIQKMLHSLSKKL